MSSTALDKKVEFVTERSRDRANIEVKEIVMDFSSSPRILSSCLATQNKTKTVQMWKRNDKLMVYVDQADGCVCESCLVQRSILLDKFLNKMVTKGHGKSVEKCRNVIERKFRKAAVQQRRDGVNTVCTTCRHLKDANAGEKDAGANRLVNGRRRTLVNIVTARGPMLKRMAYLDRLIAFCGNQGLSPEDVVEVYWDDENPWKFRYNVERDAIEVDHEERPCEPHQWHNLMDDIESWHMKYINDVSRAFKNKFLDDLEKFCCNQGLTSEDIVEIHVKDQAPWRLRYNCKEAAIEVDHEERPDEPHDWHSLRTDIDFWPANHLQNVGDVFKSKALDHLEKFCRDHVMTSKDVIEMSFNDNTSSKKHLRLRYNYDVNAVEVDNEERADEPDAWHGLRDDVKHWCLGHVHEVRTAFNNRAVIQMETFWSRWFGMICPCPRRNKTE